MPQLFVGTSGWAYPSWKPDFYPAKLAQKKFLSHYATQLNTVEVNFTFRQLVKETTIQNWIEQTPASFRFGVKAHQVITHIKRLKGTEDFVQRFLATIEPLASAGKLGPVLFQLPPNLKADSTWDLLKSSGAALCVAETEDRTTPDVVTGPFVYYRFRKPSYTDEERRGMVTRIGEHMAAGRNVFSYFKHEETPEGALYAVDLLHGSGQT